MKLVIVESPIKAKTLSGILGREYVVRASYGHIRDLPKSKLGVDVEHDFEVDYEVSDKAKKVIRELKKEAKDATEIYLATDPDREGEAISWHLKFLLEDKKRKDQVFKRVFFHEITEAEIKEAFAHPGDVNYSLVDSQQARRVLDRLVGYKLSPLLWKKVRYGLSAGRVQSVAVRLIVERERERQAFKPEEYWSIESEFNPLDNESRLVKANLTEHRGEKLEMGNESQVNEILKHIENATNFKVEKVDKSGKKKNPYPPLKTSTLQQSASNLYGFNSKKTMMVAQKLFEKGHITYHRTDSFNLSPKFIEEVRGYIKSEFGANFLPEKPNFYKSSKKTAQEAHEAIRPTSTISKIKGLTEDEFKIYSLIFKRAVECQMLPIEYLQTTYKIISSNFYGFRASGSIVTFEGWGAVGKRFNLIEDEEANYNLPDLVEGQELKIIKTMPKQHFTQPPARFSDASLIKTLEDLEIGRPSTYAPTISTIQDRGYVKKDGKYFYPDEVAYVVNDLLVKYFPEIVDFQFTAQMEEKFDEIAEGDLEWKPVIKEFYEPFEKNVKEKDKELHKADFTFMGYSEEVCPKCGSKMMFKLGKFGKFLSCSNYPVCEFAKPISGEGFDEKGNVVEYEKCEKCGGGMILKMGRFGKFLACNNFPKCKNIKKYVEKIGMKCPLCQQGEVIVKEFRERIFYGCERYPDCNFRTSKNPLTSDFVFNKEDFVGEGSKVARRARGAKTSIKKPSQEASQEASSEASRKGSTTLEDKKSVKKPLKRKGKSTNKSKSKN